MKKELLFILAMIMMVSTIEAKPIEKAGNKLDFNFALKVQPIVFNEQGIQFSLLPNGEFKFNRTNSKSYLKSRNYNWKQQRSLKILRDRKGRILKVGNVQIFYSKNNKVTQIGSVNLEYSSHGKLNKVGNLHIVQRPNRTFKYIGEVKQSIGVYFSKKPLFWS